MNSNFLNLNWMDLLKGLLVAVIGAILTGVYQALQAGTIAFTWVFWQPIVLTGVMAGIACFDHLISAAGARCPLS